jgi:thiol-disulfide isomerase/thioredoxin
MIIELFQPDRRRATLSGAAALLVGLACALPALAQSEGVSGFTRIGEYVVAIDGADAETARLFGAQRARALLILSPDLPSPVLIDLANGTVSGLQLMKVAEQADGRVDLLPNPVAQPYGAYTVDGPQIVFEVGATEVTIKPKPVLTGNRRADELVEHDPSYGTKRDAYAAAPALIEQLRRVDDEVRVRIYFGTWCPFCAEMVPRILKIAEELEGSGIRFEYYGLPRQINEDAEARAMRITGVPTGVVYRDGQEIGRINGNGWQSPEKSLLDLVQ